MATIAAEQASQQKGERDAPGGVWAALARAANAPALGSGDVWRGLERRLLTGGAPAATGMWAALAARVDLAQFRPEAVPDVAEERIVDGDQTFTVIRSPRGNYLRLTEPQREIWRQMDGTRTVAQLATQGFLKFKQLLPVGELVMALRDEGFLTDRPVGVYRAISAAVESRTAEGWGRRVLRALAGQRWQLADIDGIYTAIYRAFGWLLFTRAFGVLWALVALAGLVAFVLMLVGARPAPALLGGSVPLELASVWCALLISFLLHESAHALAVKHFGRTLRAGGMMLYFGAPAFFVDTSDIWRSPRRARLLVSAAGPMSDLLVGGIAALIVLSGAANTTISGVLYKLVFTCYVATLFNANPLLELDGYYILVDLLRLPDLRRRALAFVRGPLWKKLGAGKTKDERPMTKDTASSFGPWSLVFGRLTREERLLTLYGALTLLYSVVAIAFAVQFWNRHLGGAIVGLWASGGPLRRVLAAALFLLVVVPILAGLVFVAVGVGRAALAWVVRRGYGRQPALLGAIGLVVAVGLAWLAARWAGAAEAPYRWAGELAAPALGAVALGGLLAVWPDYRRAAVAPTLSALALMTGLAALAAVARAVGAVPAAGLSPGAWLAADGIACVFLLVAGLAALLDVDLRQARPRELALTALLLMAAFAAGGWAQTIAPAAAPAARIAIAAPAYFGALALALLLPHLFDLHDSRLLWSWLLMWLAIAAQTAAYVADLAGRALFLDALAPGLWAASWLVHLATLRQIAPDEIAWPHAPSVSEEQRLTRAFMFCYAGCYRLLRAVYGARRTRALDDRMDVLAATANWDVTLDRERARIAPAVLALPLDQQGARYAEVLRYSVATIEEIAGATFARRAIRSAYDALPWPERETASRYCFPDTPWARELSAAFGDVRDARLRLLRQVDQFLTCDDDDLAELAHAIVERELAAGEEIWRQGMPAPGLWVIEAGEVVVTLGRADGRGGSVLAELHRGDAFGGSIGQAEATYRAAIGSSLLFIPAEALAGRAAGGAGGDTGTAETLRLLERVPLFADLPRNTLRGLAHVAQQRRFAARAVIVRQGTPSGVFYIIKEGRAAVLARGSVAGEPSKVRAVAQLGREEFFGELELLRGTPPVASVVAITPLVALALPHAAVQAFILGDGRVARGLEQVGTGRLLALRDGGAGVA
jgi:putative peptide zinc metalloprotease protein